MISGATRYNIEALKQNGYKKASWHVPFSHGERSTDEQIARAIEQSLNRVDEHIRIEKQREHVSLFKTAAHRKGVGKISGGNFLNVDGITYLFRDVLGVIL